MKKTPTQKTFRMLTALVLLAALPFAMFFLEKKLVTERAPSESTNAENSGVVAEHDLSEATPEEFVKAFKYQILKNAAVEKTSEGPGISLGVFLVKNSAGQKIFACEKYQTIDMVFAAEGIAFSGEIPHMIVRGPCIVSSDQRHIEALPVPFTRILKSPVDQKEFNAEIPGLQQPVKIFFRNVVEFWPTEWNWVGVTLYGDKSGEIQEPDLNINGYEVISVIGEPVILQARPNE